MKKEGNYWERTTIKVGRGGPRGEIHKSQSESTWKKKETKIEIQRQGK